MISSISNSAILGLQKNQQQLAKTAEDIASYPVKRSNSDLTRSLVELKEQEIGIKANVKTLQAADETLGSLLDVLA